MPGHEIVGRQRPAAASAVMPVLDLRHPWHRPAVRLVQLRCDATLCERIAFGHSTPGLQTGFCKDTGGGWSTDVFAHESQTDAGPRRT